MPRTTSNPDGPKITIVTVVYNALEELKKTVQSVASQTYPHLEYIVVDGGSTDGTIEFLKSSEKVVSRWISRPDRGIYDAMNRGAELADGDYIQFLNAGDTLYSETVLSEVAQKLKENPAKVLFGRALTGSEERISWLYPSVEAPAITEWLKSHDPNHQAIFFPKSFYKKHQYDLKYKITADLDYKLRAKKEIGYLFIDRVIVKFALGGVSTQNGNFGFITQRIKESVMRNLEHRLYRELLMDPLKILFKFALAKTSGEKEYEIIKFLKKYQ
ncbi:glycosyltransferase family 2 protein [Hydrogenimonas urashimensis]|uniref:glycosyltransferase family 2 protein n=1 Tax=Hydrogenimonas urashimensis TaxID=2740515 RepID=UPI001F33546E|nr:glycosyltransferase family 2 protein [Hydrogenimonas urashimensis]